MRIDDSWLFRDIDLTVHSGQCVALVGPNGTGKSTVLRCVYGAQTPTAGTLTVCGQRPDERDVDFRRSVSVLLDDSDFFAELTARQHIELLLHSFSDEDQSTVDKLLEYAGLSHRADVPAGGLSAGQRRRLLLLGAASRSHQVLLLDEPERALDVDGKAWLPQLIGWCTDAGVAVLMATHHPALLDVADHVVSLG